MDVKSFKTDIIRPALEITGLWSKPAENLLLGTALVESNLIFFKQKPEGPAVSFFQIEPETYKDVVRYLNRIDNARLKKSILSSCYIDIFPNVNALIWNLRLAVLIARVKYFMVREALPEYDDLDGLARYWVKYYNAGGKGTVKRFTDAWESRV